MTATKMRRILGLTVIALSVLTGNVLGEDGRYRARSAQETLAHVRTLQDQAVNLETAPFGWEALDSIKDEALKQEKAGRYEWAAGIGIFGLGIVGGSVLLLLPEGKRSKAERR